jgi:hypothetical protein
VDAFMSNPMDPGYFVGPQPTSKMRGNRISGVKF